MTITQESTLYEALDTIVALRAELAALCADKERLDFVIETLNRVGTFAFGDVVRWGYPGLTREDIDFAKGKQEYHERKKRNSAIRD